MDSPKYTEVASLTLKVPASNSQRQSSVTKISTPTKPASRDHSPLTSPLNRLEAVNNQLTASIQSIDQALIANSHSHNHNKDHLKDNTSDTQTNTSDATYGDQATSRQGVIAMQPRQVSMAKPTMSSGTAINTTLGSVMLPYAMDSTQMCTGNTTVFHGATGFMAQPSTLPGQQAIDVSTIYSMVTELKTRLDNIHTTVVGLSNTKDIFANQIRTLQFDTQTQEDAMQTQKAELKQCQDKIDILSSVSIRQESEIAALKKRVIKAEQKSMKPNLVISGIKEQEGEDCVAKVQELFGQELQIRETIPIKVAHRLGKKNPNKPNQVRPIVAKLKKPDEKAKIFPQLKLLKGSKKYVNDQLPEEVDEERRRERQIVAANKKLPVSQQQKLKFKKNKLLVGANMIPYKAKIQAPTASDLLKLKEEDIKDLQTVPMEWSSIKEEKGSRFVSYASQVTCLSDINVRYLHMRLKYKDATHVMMAYRLPGLQPTRDEGYCDDGEIGAGRKLLQYFKRGRESGYSSICGQILRTGDAL